MHQHYEDFLVYKGEKFAVYFHAQEHNVSSVYEYYLDCDDITRASLLFLVKRIADVGHIYDQTKFRIEDKDHKIYCFKPKKERFFCFFFTGRKIIITSGYCKKQQKLDRFALAMAIKIRSEYV